jgi:hypothetical protein
MLIISGIVREIAKDRSSFGLGLDGEFGLWLALLLELRLG